MIPAKLANGNRSVSSKLELGAESLRVVATWLSMRKYETYMLTYGEPA